MGSPPSRAPRRSCTARRSRCRVTRTSTSAGRFARSSRRLPRWVCKRSRPRRGHRVFGSPTCRITCMPVQTPPGFSSNPNSPPPPHPLSQPNPCAGRRLQEGRRAQLNFINPEHILIALLNQPDQAARTLLERSGARPLRSRGDRRPSLRYLCGCVGYVFGTSQAAVCADGRSHRPSLHCRSCPCGRSVRAAAWERMATCCVQRR